jgi:hypothetical protein
LGHSFSNLGADGVYRVYHSSSFEVIDAVRLSTIQIKELLDRGAFDQATEDKFRGVDGRGVSDEDMFNPPEKIRTKRPTAEEYKELRRLINENNVKLKAVRTECSIVCGLRKSDYNLDPI